MLTGGLSLASAAALLGLIAVNASSAGAAVTVGQTFTPEQDFGGSGVFIQSGSPDNSYTIPTDGVITSWSFEAIGSEATPPLKLKVVRHAGGDDFTTLGDSQLQTPNPGVLNAWPTRIAVKAGDLLAHFYSDSTFGYRSPPGYKTNEISGSPGDPSLDPPPGTTITYEPPSASSHQHDLAVVLESDGDRDDFGDETQDKCLGTPGSFSGCPNTVRIDKLKQMGETKVKVTASVPGAGTLAVGSPGDKKLASASAKALKAVKRTITGTSQQTVTLTVKLTKSGSGSSPTSGSSRSRLKAVYTPLGGPPGSSIKKKKLKS